jgi:hypothetical protein
MKAHSKEIKIALAEYVGGYRLHLMFSDGHEQTVDFGPFLKGSLHPEIRKYLKSETFRRFRVDNGELMWGDFDLIFPVMDLYTNSVMQPETQFQKPRFSSRGR